LRARKEASRGGEVGFKPIDWFNGGIFDDDAALRCDGHPTRRIEKQIGRRLTPRHLGGAEDVRVKALEEAAINERLARFHALIQQAGAEAPQVNHWGKRTLAYPVKKRETGYYVVAKFDAAATALLEPMRAYFESMAGALTRATAAARAAGNDRAVAAKPSLSAGLPN
jgi:ribosomal protein S6